MAMIGNFKNENSGLCSEDCLFKDSAHSKKYYTSSFQLENKELIIWAQYEGSVHKTRTDVVPSLSNLLYAEHLFRQRSTFQTVHLVEKSVLYSFP